MLAVRNCQIVKIQNCPYRMKRLLDESTKEVHTFTDQIKDEHFRIVQLIGKVFPSASIADDSQCVRKEMQCLETIYDANHRPLTDYD
jgi:hypothetical protein